MTAAKFVQARNYTKGPRNCVIRLLVIHTMESPEKPDTAENVAAWFAGPSAPQASAHYCIDSNSVVQCVKDSDIAWAAPGANHDGLHLEHAGGASQGAEGWADWYSKAELTRSAALAADLCARYHIPAVHLTEAQLATGHHGIVGHADVTAWQKSLGKPGDHTDPGPTFPWKRYIGLVSAHLATHHA